MKSHVLKFYYIIYFARFWNNHQLEHGTMIKHILAESVFLSVTIKIMTFGYNLYFVTIFTFHSLLQKICYFGVISIFQGINTPSTLRHTD